MTLPNRLFILFRSQCQLTIQADTTLAPSTATTRPRCVVITSKQECASSWRIAALPTVTTSFAIWQTLSHLSPERCFYTVLPIWNFCQATVTFRSSSLTPIRQMVKLISIKTWVSTSMANSPTSATPWAKMTNNSFTAKCRHHPTIKTTVLGKSSTCNSESTEELLAQWIPLASHLTTSLPLATTPWLEAYNRTRSQCLTLSNPLKWASSLRTRNPWLTINSNSAKPMASQRELARILGRSDYRPQGANSELS